MSVGYKPYVNRYSAPKRMCRRNTSAVLTETYAMTVKPGLGIWPDFPREYKTCKSVVNLSVGVDASGNGTYPKEAMNKTRLDKQSE